MFDVVNEGTLFAVWGENVPGQVLAYFTPNKPVPAFKFSSSSGKTELMRKFRGEKARFYQGCTQFFKLAKDYDGNCYGLCSSIGIFFRTLPDGLLVQLQPGASEPITVPNLTAVVVLSAATISLAAGSTMMQEQFLRIGISEGWGLAL